ncbi:MAG: leucine-rich repeat protein [Clostridia bacterium]|nr:leucine-rich repeat protein [Clostridia bacterium]
MKKKLFLAFLILTMLICIFALSVSAEETKTMDYDRTYTLNGVSYPLWEQDNEGNYHPLIWYLNSENEMCSAWADGETNADGTYVNLGCFEGQLSKMTVYESDGASYTSDLSFVIVNLNGVQLNHNGELWPIKYVHAKAFHTNTTISNSVELKLNENNVLKAVFLPETLIHIGWANAHVANTVAAFYSFNNCTALEYVELHKDTQLDDKTLNRGAFLNCSSLKALSLPDCITTIGNAALADCSSLEAVYLSQDLTTLSNGGNPFANNSNLYFVNESFIMNSSEDIPQKPEVYCFPSGLTSFGAAILSPKANKTVVISENVTSHSTKMFAGSGVETVVYLGNMTSFALTATQSTALNVLMPNTTAEPTVSASGDSFSGSTVSLCKLNKYLVLGENEWKTGTIHAEDPSKAIVIKEATCVDNAKVDTYCFCGEYIGIADAEGTAGGDRHNLENSTIINIVYDDFTTDGYKIIRCAMCGSENITEKAEALFTCLGYSHTTGAIMQGFQINKEAIDDYNKYVTTPIKYGILAASGNIANIYLGGFNDKVINVDFTNRSYDIMEMKIYGITSATQDTQLYCCGYVIVDGEIIYMDEKMAEGAELPTTVTYDGLGGAFAQTASLEAVVPTKEEVLA